MLISTPKTTANVTFRKHQNKIVWIKMKLQVKKCFEKPSINQHEEC